MGNTSQCLSFTSCCPTFSLDMIIDHEHNKTAFATILHAKRSFLNKIAERNTDGLKM